LNAALLYLFLLHLPVGIEELQLALRSWPQAEPRIGLAAGGALAMAAAGVLTVWRLDPAWRARGVYFRMRFAHPAHEAFFSLKEPPFDRKPLHLRYPEVRDSAWDPHVQYATWQRLADKHAGVPMIRGAQAGWRLLGDLHLLGLLFLGGFLVGWLFNSGVDPVLASSYLFLFGAQALSLMFIARGTGRRLVNNVLAVELVAPVEARETDRGKPPQKGKRRT
jgi:hypothetical protein